MGSVYVHGCIIVCHGGELRIQCTPYLAQGDDMECPMEWGKLPWGSSLMDERAVSTPATQPELSDASNYASQTLIDFLTIVNPPCSIERRILKIEPEQKPDSERTTENLEDGELLRPQGQKAGCRQRHSSETGEIFTTAKGTALGREIVRHPVARAPGKRKACMLTDFL